MTQNHHDFKSLTMPLLLAAVLMLVAGLAYFNLTPKAYRATAVVKVLKIGVIDPNAQSSEKNAEDAGLAATEASMLRSKTIVTQVINNLQLAKMWSGSIGLLSDKQVQARFDQIIRINSRTKSSVIDITVTSSNRYETAIIANEFAKVYVKFREREGTAAIDSGMDSVHKQWEAQNKALEFAQSHVVSFSRTNGSTNLNNDTLYTDSPRYEALKKEQGELQEQTKQLQANLSHFGNTNKSELRFLLHSADGDTNSVFNTAYAKWRNAEKQLTQAKIEHGDDSPQYKRAKLLSDNLDSQLSRITDGISLMKQSQLPGLELGLDQINTELKTAKPKEIAAAAKIGSQAFFDAQAQLREATIQRDLLQREMNDRLSLALIPVVIKPQIIEAAETPVMPSIPDKETAGLMVATGFVLMLLGLLAFLLGNRTRAAKLKP